MVLDSLEKELRSKLKKYEAIDKKFRQKYNSSFQEIEKTNFLKRNNYIWKVEKDFIDWEHAVKGIRYCKEKLKELRRWRTLLLLQK